MIKILNNHNNNKKENTRLHDNKKESIQKNLSNNTEKKSIVNKIKIHFFNKENYCKRKKCKMECNFFVLINKTNLNKLLRNHFTNEIQIGAFVIR